MFSTNEKSRIEKKKLLCLIPKSSGVAGGGGGVSLSLSDAPTGKSKSE